MIEKKSKPVSYFADRHRLREELDDAKGKLAEARDEIANLHAKIDDVRLASEVLEKTAKDRLDRLVRTEHQLARERGAYDALCTQRPWDTQFNGKRPDRDNSCTVACVMAGFDARYADVEFYGITREKRHRLSI